MAYTVTLVDFPNLPADVQATAEDRFRRALDKALTTDVEAVLAAFQNASESAEADVAAEDWELAQRWPKAYDTAMQAGFRGLGDADGAHFDVRIIRA